MVRVFFFAFLLFSSLYSFAASDELKFVAVFIRHGARSPQFQIPELDSKTSWDRGYGQLTPSGQRQLYLLGKMFRKYYVDDLSFLSTNYNKSEIYVQSTAFERTIMSAESFLQGLYRDGLEKLTEDQKKCKEIWTPPFNLTLNDMVVNGLNDSAFPFDMPTIPIISHSLNFDKFLHFSSCAKYLKIRNDFYKSQEFQAAYKKYEANITAICGLLNVNCSAYTPNQYFALVDYLLAAEFDGQLPMITEKPEYVDALERFYADMMKGELTLKELPRKVTMYNFSRTIPAFAKKVMEHDKDFKPKLALFATHDSTLISFLNGLGASMDEYVPKIPYASFMVVEISKKAGDDKDEKLYTVNITFNSKSVYTMDYKKWVETIAKVGDIDWNSVCSVPQAEVDDVLEAAKFFKEPLTHDMITIDGESDDEKDKEWFMWKCIICIGIVVILTFIECICAWRDIKKSTPKQEPIPVYHQLGVSSI